MLISITWNLLNLFQWEILIKHFTLSLAKSSTLKEHRPIKLISLLLKFYYNIIITFIYVIYAPRFIAMVVVPHAVCISVVDTMNGIPSSISHSKHFEPLQRKHTRVRRQHLSRKRWWNGAKNIIFDKFPTAHTAQHKRNV